MFGLATYGLMILALVVGIWRNPGVTLVAVLCLFAIDQWGLVSSPFLWENSAISNILLGSIVLIGFIKSFLSGRIVRFYFRKNKIYVVSVIFLLYAALSILWSPVQALAAEKWLDQAPYFIVMVVLMPMTLNNPYLVEKSLLFFQAFGTVLVVLFLFFVEWRGRGIVVEGAGDGLALPLAIAQLAAMTFFASLFYRHNKFNFVMVFRIASMCMAVFLILLTGSRGPLFSLVFCGAIFFPYYLQSKNIKNIVSGMVVFAIVGTALYVGFNQFSSMDTRWSQEELSEDMFGRFHNTAIVLSAWADGNILIWFFGLGSSASFDPDIYGFYPHNVPMEILAEEGLIGFGLFLYLLVLTLQYVRKHIKLSKTDSDGHYAVAVFSAGALFLFIHSLKSGALVGSSYLFMIFVVLERFYHLRLDRDRYVSARRSNNQPID